jgi:hypothetical protein
MTIDTPRPAWETELGLRVAADHDLAAPKPRFSANDHGEIWSSARWAAVAADMQEGVRMSEGDWSMVNPATVDLHLGWAEHLLDNLDEMAAETAQRGDLTYGADSDHEADGS